MLYAIVQDVPASWAHYAATAAGMCDPLPDGLILHVAGPTDEGFRTIEIWETREAWERCRAARSAVPTPSLIVKPTLRALEAPTALGRLVRPRIEVPSTHQPKEEA